MIRSTTQKGMFLGVIFALGGLYCPVHGMEWVKSLISGTKPNIEALKEQHQRERWQQQAMHTKELFDQQKKEKEQRDQQELQNLMSLKQALPAIHAKAQQDEQARLAALAQQPQRTRMQITVIPEPVPPVTPVFDGPVPQTLVHGTEQLVAQQPLMAVATNSGTTEAVRGLPSGTRPPR